MELVKQAIGRELLEFDHFLQKELQSHVYLADKILKYVSSKKGKQVRPMFVLLCARLGGPINDQSYRAALFVELIHTSSLMHDDIVDESYQRRGALSVNALWNNKAALLTGNILFFQSITLLHNSQDYGLLKIFSKATERVVKGELLQLEKSKKINRNEAAYLDVIKGKTATLLASACAGGAFSTFKNESEIQKLYLFGEKLGMAFQIKDDIFDYQAQNVGKPTGNDIKEQKVALPLLYTLNNCSFFLRRKLLFILRFRNKNEKKIQFLIEAVRKSGGIDYAEKKMVLYTNEALELLGTFPESPARSALEELAYFVIQRKK